jgi:hypothetical protein
LCVVITSQVLREIAADGPDTMVIGHSGELVEIGGLPEPAPIPALVVEVVTEAVKQVEAGMVIRYLNRETLWAVTGFLLDREVVARLPDGVDSAAGLIQAVRDAGYEWQAVLPLTTETQD